MVTRRTFLKHGSLAAVSTVVPGRSFGVPTDSGPADYTLEIAPTTLDLSPKHSIRTVAYNGQVPGPVLRFTEGKRVVIDVTNHSANEEVVHWHGLFLPPDVDGAMEEGTPMIPRGGRTRLSFTPQPAGFRWYHTHTFAGGDLKKGQYSGQHGFLMIDPAGGAANLAPYDREFFLALHDWDGEMAGGADGSMNPAYRFSTVNGKMLAFGEPLRVRQGERVLLHLLNASATDQHWVALAGHSFRVIALDGNAVPTPQTVPMLRLAPAERVCAVVEMNNPGVWILGEVRKHIQAAGMGIVVEYSGRSGKPSWQQPGGLVWNYSQFQAAMAVPSADKDVIEMPLVFASKFAGHGAPDHWTINGQSWPKVESAPLRRGRRYRLRFNNTSSDDHPVHLHRHSFELRRLAGNAEGSPEIHGILKDVVLVEAGTEVEVEFTANHPGDTLFHCHQQNHMDEGFMMLFRYA